MSVSEWMGVARGYKKQVEEHEETISKLKDLVEDAYFCGVDDGQNDVDGCWDGSNTKSELEKL